MKTSTVFLSICMLFAGLSSCGSPTGSHPAEEGEEAHAHEGAVVMEPDRAKSFGVKTAKLTPAPFSETLRVSGRVEPSASDRMTVTARKSGVFTLSPGITTGCKVASGQAIGTISSRGVQGGDPNAAANANLEAAANEVKRLSPLFKEGLVTASAYNDAVRAYKEAQALAGSTPGGSSSATSPGAGTLTDLYVATGQYVEVGTPIAAIARNTRMTLRADIPARYTSSVASFTSANFRPDHTEQTFSLSDLDGKRISPADATEAVNGYIPLYFSFTGNGEIIPGAFAEIFLIGQPRENVLSVPKEAIIEMQGNKYAYVCHDGHAYEKRLVRTGASDGERIEILDGIKEGEEVVMAGATVVRMAETSAIAPPGHTHNH